MSATSVSIPEIGMGATIAIGTDRYPATVVHVSLFKTGLRQGQVRQVTVQQDTATVSGGTWPNLEYEYNPDPNGRVFVYTVDNRGKLFSHGARLLLGYRRRYNDPHF